MILIVSRLTPSDKCTISKVLPLRLVSSVINTTYFGSLTATADIDVLSQLEPNVLVVTKGPPGAVGSASDS